MCIVGLSESGHGGRFEPCAECKRLEAEVENLKRKRIEDAGLHERDLALNEYKLRNDDLCERRANQLHKLILAILSGKEAEFIGELEETRDRYFHLGMKQSNKIAALEAENAALRQELESSQQDHLDTIIERDALRQDRDRLAGIAEKADVPAADVLANCEDCCERCEECVFATAAQKAKACQEARHAKP